MKTPGDRRRGYSRREAIGAIAGIGGVALAGCLSRGDGGPSGSLDASGSNVVGPITQAAAEDFEREFPGAMINVDPQGTGAGFSRFTRADSAIQSASREITDSERAQAEAHGVEFSKYTVGLDGIAVVKNANNDWLEEITLEELREIWTFQSEVETWNDVRPEYPDEPIVLYGRDDASGTFDFFTEVIIGERGYIRYGYSAHSQTNNIMRAVASDVNALGWGGFGYHRHYAEDVDLVPVESDQGDGYYVPTHETVEESTYSPLSRPLFIYINHAILAEQPDLLGSFCRFYFDGQRDFARETGYAPTPPETVEENHDRFDDVLANLGIEEGVLTYQRS